MAPDIVPWFYIAACAVCFCFSEYFYEQEERTDEETEPTFSEDEAVSQKGLRRSQSVKITRSKVRKDASGLLYTADRKKSIQNYIYKMEIIHENMKKFPWRVCLFVCMLIHSCLL